MVSELFGQSRCIIICVPGVRVPPPLLIEPQLLSGDWGSFCIPPRLVPFSGIVSGPISFVFPTIVISERVGKRGPMIVLSRAFAPMPFAFSFIN